MGEHLKVLSLEPAEVCGKLTVYGVKQVVLYKNVAYRMSLLNYVPSEDSFVWPMVKRPALTKKAYFDIEHVSSKTARYGTQELFRCKSRLKLGYRRLQYIHRCSTRDCFEFCLITTEQLFN